MRFNLEDTTMETIQKRLEEYRNTIFQGLPADQHEELMNKIKQLSRLQMGFVLAILDNPNMPRYKAYWKAGGKCRNRRTATSEAGRIYANPHVQEVLGPLEDLAKLRAVNDSVMTRAEAIERLTSMARTQMNEVVDFHEVEIGRRPDGTPLHQTSWTLKEGATEDDDVMGSIAELSSSGDGFKFKLHDPKACMALLAKIEGWEAPSRTEVSGPEGGPVEVKSLSDEDLARRLAFLLSNPKLAKRGEGAYTTDETVAPGG
jgi:phage terminase small subunit